MQPSNLGELRRMVEEERKRMAIRAAAPNGSYEALVATAEWHTSFIELEHCLTSNALALLDVCEAAAAYEGFLDCDDVRCICERCKYGRLLRAALEKLGNRTPSADLRRDGAASAKAE